MQGLLLHRQLCLLHMLIYDIYSILSDQNETFFSASFHI